MPATPEKVTEAKDAHGHALPLVTDYVACFVAGTQWEDLPEDVRHLGKRSMIDGIGLALAGAVSGCGHIAQRYLAELGVAHDSGCSVIGTGLRVPARFAAFANGGPAPTAE